ncbi:hypothetical protein FE257_005695 [Aspergillus nanangensis]|uniref:Uncharacterized protein n=1 Tax=Aspergillus nanangensis TaxID=2582783 RepID=A0AAD4GUF2_ASPNN|nr:hypothetical protein FE257_005695 [Aspergillus nanangensis]
MKLSLAAASSFVAASVAASLPEAFTLVAQGGHTVLTDGTNAVISHNVSDTLPILILHGANGGATYTRQGSPPTAWQNLYVIAGADKPIGLTIPHSGALPDNAKTSGFAMTDDGWLTFEGEQAFAPTTEVDEHQNIVYLGANNGGYQQAPIWVKECRGC